MTFSVLIDNPLMAVAPLVSRDLLLGVALEEAGSAASLSHMSLKFKLK